MQKVFKFKKVLKRQEKSVCYTERKKENYIRHALVNMQIRKKELSMAKLERSINENFDQLLLNIESGILNSSMSASLEESSDFRSGSARCSVRVFERYSYTGGNRVSMSVTLFQNGVDEPVQLSAITAGGSQAVFFKINTWGEEAFLDKLNELLD